MKIFSTKQNSGIKLLWIIFETFERTLYSL